MAASIYGQKLEALVAEYAAAKKHVEESPLFSGDPTQRVYKYGDTHAVALVERYEKVRADLAHVGITVTSILGGAMLEPQIKRMRNVELMPLTSTWAQGYYALRAACEENDKNGRTVTHPTYLLEGLLIYRPLTFGENLRARIADARVYNNDLTQALSWSRWNESCTAIIYGTDGKFKIQKISHDLLSLAPDFRQKFVQGRYDTVVANNVSAMEFVRRGAKYNEGLTQDEVRRHPFWQFVADGNTDVLWEYTQLQWAGKQPGYKGMGVWLRDSPTNGELRALFVGSRSVGSGAVGKVSLGGSGSFLRVVS